MSAHRGGTRGITNSNTAAASNASNKRNSIDNGQKEHAIKSPTTMLLSLDNNSSAKNVQQQDYSSCTNAATGATVPGASSMNPPAPPTLGPNTVKN